MAYQLSMEEKKWLTLLFLMPSLSKASPDKIFWIKINLVVLRKTYEHTKLIWDQFGGLPLAQITSV